MAEKNLTMRLVIIVACILASVYLLIDVRPDGSIGTKLRPGIDIAGGISMIFEIDDTGISDPNLAENVKTVLQKRVDPQGVYNLTWRVLGKNRLEVQMPLPPKGATQLRSEYDAARDELFRATLKRSTLEDALALPAEQRSAELTKLAGGSADRENLLKVAASTYDSRAAAHAALTAASQPAESAPAEPVNLDALRKAQREADGAFEDAVEAVLATNLDPVRFQDILELEEKSSSRAKSIEDLKASHPSQATQIDKVVSLYSKWHENRGYLDGPEDLQRLLHGAGVLEFRILAEQGGDTTGKYERLRKQLVETGPRPLPGDTEGWFKIDNPTQFFNLESPRELEKRDVRSFGYVVDKRGSDYYVLSKLGPDDGLLANAAEKWSLKRAFINRDQHGRLCVNFQLDVVGGSLFEKLTSRNIGKPMCILVDNVAYSVATIQSKIGQSGQITGDFSYEKVQYLVQTMQAGALPARLKETPISERTIGSSLGEANRDKALRSGLIGAVVIISMMAGYYLWAGMVANFAMMLNILLTLAVLAMLNARITLDGIAGIILAVGMAVDANVLIYERMREEKERGASLRMIIKNGFDRAFVTIFDSNITTLLTCLILYYVGSEEVKGFGLTLGWGVVINLFTSVFVTRTLFTLLVKYRVLKDIRLNKLIGTPKIDWYSKRRIFVPLSLVVIVCGFGLLFLRGKQDLFDVEFLGGVTAEVELKQAGMRDDTITRRLDEVAKQIGNDISRLRDATVEPVADQRNTFRVRVPNVSSMRLAALITEPLDERNRLQRGGVEPSKTDESVMVRIKDPENAEGFDAGRALRDALVEISNHARLTVDALTRASVHSVLEVGQSEADKGRFWSITTTETNKRLVQSALVAAMGDNLRIRPRVDFVVKSENGQAVPILARRLDGVLHDLPAGGATDVSDFVGGAAIWLSELNPPLSVEGLTDRLKNMRLQPGYQNMPWREFRVFPIVRADEQRDESGNPVFSSVVIAIVDPNVSYKQDPATWSSNFAAKELDLVEATLNNEQSLRKVTQFKPQIAAQATQNAILALVLSWIMIIAYLWVRFGKPRYGVAGVVALIHDVAVATAFVALSGIIARSFLGPLLLVEDFKINMPIIAAILTIIGFSINDTIVVFDRVREVRGRLGLLTPQIINDSINQCFARTVLTTSTVLIVVLCMYIFGGSSIRGFNWCMLIGTVTGAYSTIAIASPLVLMHWREAALARNMGELVPTTARASR